MKRYVFAALAFFSGAVLFALGAGEKRVTISLPGNPTTGFSWGYSMAPLGVAREVSNVYKPEKTNRVGSGGTFMFTFEGESAGETVLTFVYRRPWETDTPPAEVKIFVVTVDERKNITADERIKIK